MSALISFGELPQWVPGKVLGASDDLGWTGVNTRSYRYTGLDVDIPGMRDFMIVSYRRGATRMERRFDGAWTKTQCSAGDVSLLTRSQWSHWQWTDDVDVTHVYLTEALVSNVANEAMDRCVAEVRLHDVLRTHDPVVTAMVDAIAQEARQRHVGGALYAEALGTQLAVHLLRHYASVKFSEPLGKASLSPQQMKRIAEYIDSHLHESSSLHVLAAVLGLGVWSFGRRFRESFGVAPHRYVIERRVERAERLLTQGSMPLKEVACACGFADQAHMTRMLRSRRAITPAALRQSHRH